MINFINELNNYQPIPRELIFDNSLSDRARFVYVYMASKPNGWSFFIEPMAKDIGYSTDTLRKYINELITSGWLIKGEQQKDKGMFGAVQYTLKATKNTVSEKVRDGKNTTQKEKRDIEQKRDEKEEIKEYKEKFDAFVLAYKKAGGRVRNADTEFKDFTKRHKDWKQVIPYLGMALQREIKARNQAKANNKFYPAIKNLITYLGKQRAWEMYVTIGEEIKNNEYTPECGGALTWNDYYNCYIYTSMFVEDLTDGYNDNNRPDGATIMLNNGRGFIVWNAEKKEWQNKK